MSISGNNFGEEFLTVADVAEFLKLNQQTVRNWIDQGSLPAVRVGRRVRIRRSELERVIEQGSTQGGQGRGESGATDAAEPDAGTHPGPNAADFWGGEPVGLAEP